MALLGVYDLVGVYESNATVVDSSVAILAKKPSVLFDANASTPTPLSTINITSNKPTVTIIGEATLVSPGLLLNVLSKKPIVDFDGVAELDTPIISVTVVNKKPTVVSSGSSTFPNPQSLLAIFAKKPTVTFSGGATLPITEGLWPSQLPQSPLVNGYKEVRRDSMLRFEPDLGSAKERQQFTKIPYDITENYIMTKDQYLILESFFNNQCQRGASPFIKFHAYKNVNNFYKFKQPPSYNVIGDTYVVNCELEILPF